MRARRAISPDAAEDFYRHALEKDCGHRGILNYLGQLYLETVRLDGACFFGCKEYDMLKAALHSGTVNTY